MEYITVTEAAQMLGVNAETIRRWIRSGKLKAYQKPGRGRALFVEKSAVEKFMRLVPVEVKPGKKK